MNKCLSIIIPSYNRDDLLTNNLLQIVSRFNNIDFVDYEIVVVYSGRPINLVSSVILKFENVPQIKFYVVENKLAPGIARNIGVEHSTAKWIWFVDDDDQLVFDHIHEILNTIETDDSTIDVIAHSLKFEYKNTNDLINSILLFREKQEVFRLIFKKSLVINNKIQFSDGLHEDIRYVTQILLAASNTYIVNKLIYNKITNDDSITKTLTLDRLDGYVNAAKEILDINHVLIQNQKNNFVTQLLGTILYLINQLDNSIKNKYINYLDAIFTVDLRKHITEKYNKKHTNFKYAVALYLSKKNNDEFINDLKDCFESYLSCSDLRHSIFLGPQEIIGCCKRFFYKGKMKGDIILLKESNDITLKKIIDRKREIETLINMDSYEECEGCPYIERYNKNQDEKIRYISFENFNYCNMKCSYCSPKYYGGRESTYDSDEIITDLLNSEMLDSKVHVVWGGGEPTLSIKFKNITSKLLNNDNISKIRVLSNSLKFSNDLYNFASNEKVRIVTSIDAGTQNNFQKVRGKGNLTQVLDNLNKYNSQVLHPENLTLKYIITDDNYTTDELENFVSILNKYKFENNFIQISCNFLFEKTELKTTFAIYELAARLLSSGFKYVYFDDLIRDRLTMTNEIANQIIQYLTDQNICHENILSYRSKQNAVLWGDGYQSKWIQNNTTFGKAKKIVKIVTSADALQSNIFDDNTILCPAAVQQLPEVYKDITKNSTLQNKLVFGIFL